MAFTFDSTPGSSTSNSYLSVSEADDYFAGRFGSDAWMTFSNAQKQQLIVTASKEIDNASFSGIKSKVIQSLQWPRRGCVDRDGVSIVDTVVPAKLKEAVCEMAYWIWTEEDRLLSDTEIQQVDTYQVGPINVSVNKSRVIFPKKVTELLKAIGIGVLLGIGGKTNQQVGLSR
jgi:hypothetical protein